MNSKRNQCLGFLLGLLPLVVACSSAETPDASGSAPGGGEPEASADALGVLHDVAPLYTIDLGNSSAVYLWEHRPGLINYSESARAGVTMPHLAHDLSGRVTEIFRALKPGVTMPDVLADAQVREDERLAALAARGELREKHERDLVSTSITPPFNPGVTIEEDTALAFVQKDAWHEWFEENMCRGNVLLRWPPIGVVEWCALHRKDGGVWHFQDRAELLATVMPYTGTVTFKLVVNWNGGSSTSTKTANVATGFAYAWDFYDDSLNDEHDYQFSILNATGDNYHRAVVSAWNFCPSGCAPASLDQCLCPQ